MIIFWKERIGEKLEKGERELKRLKLGAREAELSSFLSRFFKKSLFFFRKARRAFLFCLSQVSLQGFARVPVFPRAFRALGERVGVTNNGRKG